MLGPTGGAVSSLATVDSYAAGTSFERSIYRWKGEIHDDQESQLVIKTTRDRFEALEAHVRANHPYEVPEIVALPIIAGSAAYLEWLRG